METRVTKIISRINCPETNSSSSHSFVFSEESLKPEDLLLSTQTLIPKIKSDGTKYIELDGINDSYESGGKRANDSKTKAIYAIASARMILKSRSAKKKIEEIKEVIKSTLGVDEVIITRQKGFTIDHQSWDILEPIINGDEFGLREFIFNPRIWLFLLWDSEDCYDNPIFDVCPGYFNFEVSTELPVKVKKFLEDPEIQEIEFTRLFKDYPELNNITDFVTEEIWGNGIYGYSEKDETIIIDENHPSYYYNMTSTTNNNPDVFEYLGVLSKEKDLYLFYIRSTLWEEIYNNYKKRFEISDPSNESREKKYSEEFQSKLDEITIWKKLDSSPASYKNILFSLFNSPVLDEKLLEDLNLNDKDIKLFKLSIYSRRANEFI